MNWDFGERFWGVYRRLNPMVVIFGGLIVVGALGALVLLAAEAALRWVLS